MENAKTQSCLGNGVKSTTISGLNLNNWYDKQKKETLLRNLMTIESIYSKTVATSKKNSGFKGRLFYSIIPNSKTKSVTFYYSSANYQEGESVARAIACFIKESLELDPSFYCSYNLVAEGLNGEWDNSKQIFLTCAEKAEQEKLGDLTISMMAKNIEYISIDHQRAMATENDTISMASSRLTKGSKEPKKASRGNEDDKLSDMTGSTSDSKAQRFADSAVKEVAIQYNETINDLTEEIEDAALTLDAKDLEIAT